MTPAAKQRNLDRNLPILQQMIRLLALKAKEYNTNCWRLQKDGFVSVDIFPATNRCFFHDIESTSPDCYGDIACLERFLMFQFTKRK